MKKILSLIFSVIILCAACAAQATGEEPPAFTCVRDVLDHAGDNAVVEGHEDDTVLILETSGRYFRMVALADDHAKELYQAATGEDYSLSAMEAFNDYTWTLPFSYTEELAETPKSQAELDALKGKTIQDLMDEGFGKEMIIDHDEIMNPVHIYLEYGFFRYVFEVNNAASGDPHIMTIKTGKLCGFSRAAFDIDNPEKPSDPQ